MFLIYLQSVFKVCLMALLYCLRLTQSPLEYIVWHQKRRIRKHLMVLEFSNCLAIMDQTTSVWWWIIVLQGACSCLWDSYSHFPVCLGSPCDVYLKNHGFLKEFESFYVSLKQCCSYLLFLVLLMVFLGQECSMYLAKAYVRRDKEEPVDCWEMLSIRYGLRLMLRFL
jgi:hypothetical protein